MGWRAVTPFALDSLARCDVDPPPPLTSFEYALNDIEVKLFGSATSKFRIAIGAGDLHGRRDESRASLCLQSQTGQ